MHREYFRFRLAVLREFYRAGAGIWAYTQPLELFFWALKFCVDVTGFFSVLLFLVLFYYYILVFNFGGSGAHPAVLRAYFSL